MMYFQSLFLALLSISIFQTEATSIFLNNLLSVANGGVKFLRESQIRNSKELPNQTPQNGEVYDFIIIGSGSAGSVLASRLSENPAVRVLLIEEGGPEKLRMDIPSLALHQYLLGTKDIFWDYGTEPSNDYCMARKSNSCVFPMGKVMGGTSVVNLMIAIRGK